MRKYVLLGLCGFFALGAIGAPVALNLITRSVKIQPSQETPVEPDAGKRKSLITEENFKKVETGMTEQQVVEILGPPGVHTARDTYYYTPPMPSMGYRWKKSVDVCLDDDRRFPTDGRKTWYGDSAFITIYFSPAGTVTEYGYAGGKYFDRAYLATDPDPYPNGK
jgi:SmpA / OmlA family